ncbi:MAG: tRNA methyltransferase [Armatimonadetes bacterium]|nr:tRNA methyltransferase [Armatimonadota bacterium]
MFRVADGVGASLIVTTGHTPHPPDPMIGVTSLGHHRRIPFRHHQSHEAGALELKAAGWTLIAVEIAEGAVAYFDFHFPQKTCLVLGNEVNGVYGGVMKHCDAAVYIPMLGKGRSLNVHVAAAVVAYRAQFGR